jgi:hypothetical protein
VVLEFGYSQLPTIVEAYLEILNNSYTVRRSTHNVQRAGFSHYIGNEKDNARNAKYSIKILSDMSLFSKLKYFQLHLSNFAFKSQI